MRLQITHSKSPESFKRTSNRTIVLFAKKNRDSFMFRRLNNEHSIAITEKTILFPDRCLICFHC
jgi:hypothetical protein